MADMCCSSPIDQQSSEPGSSTSSAGSVSDQLEATAGLSSDEEFFMYQFKVLPCPETEEHSHEDCPYAHPAEKATRRDPRVYPYTGVSCPSYRKGSCKDGNACQYAHGVFEVWLHPSRFRTELCKDGPSCTRKCCFFAHTPEQLRQPSPEDPSVQVLAQKAAQRAALASRTNSSNSSTCSMYTGLKAASSISSADSASSSMLRAAVRNNAGSPANGTHVLAGKQGQVQALYSRTSTPAQGSFNNLPQLETKLSGLTYSAQASAGSSAATGSATLSHSRFLLQQAAAQGLGIDSCSLGVGGMQPAAASAPQQVAHAAAANGLTSGMLFGLPAASDCVFSAAPVSAGVPMQQQTHAQHLPAAVGALPSFGGSRALQQMGLPAGSLAGNLSPGLAGLALGSNSADLSNSSNTGLAAAAALDIISAQQQDLATACMLQQLLLEYQQQQQLLQARQQQQQQQDEQQGHLFQMWSAAFNAAKGVGLQPSQAAACADCAVEQTVGSLVPQLMASQASTAPFMGAAGNTASCVPAGSSSPPVGAAFGAGPGVKGAPAAAGFGGYPVLQQAGFQQMLLMHGAQELKHMTGDMLAGFMSGLRV